MMYPRLYTSRNLLTEDGAVFISINDHEQPNLKSLCDVVFGEENFVGQLVWAAGRKNDSKLISMSHEYIICYTRNKLSLDDNKVHWRQRKQGLDEIYQKYESLKRQHGNQYQAIETKLKEWYRNLPDGNPSKRLSHYSCIDARGIYFPDNISWPGGGGPKYEVLHPITNRPCKTPSRGWMFSDPEKMKAVTADDRVHFGADESKVPCIKAYLEDREMEVPYSVFYRDGRAATKRLRSLLGGDLFDYPKDEIVLREIIESVTYKDSEAIILDFFAGSATTAHAVALCNHQDGGVRKFLMVQLPEPCVEGSAAHEKGYATISDIAKDRIRSLKHDPELKSHNTSRDFRVDLDLGFRVFKLDRSNFKVWNGDTEGFRRKRRPT